MAFDCSFINSFHEVVYKVLDSKLKIENSSYGIVAINRATSEIICENFVNKDKILYPASSIKTLIAMAVLKKIDAGEISFIDKIKISQLNADIESKHVGKTKYLRGKTRTVLELISDMIIYSNNIATNELIDIAGKDYINQLADELEAYNARVYKKMYSEVPIDTDIQERNTITSYDLAQIYFEIATGKKQILKNSSRQFLIDILGKIKNNDRLNYKFPKDVLFYHKTGSTSKTSSDAGFFHLNGNIDIILIGLQDFSCFKTLSIIGEEVIKALLENGMQLKI